MAQLRSALFLGQPSTHAAAHTVSKSDYCVAFAISGPDASSISQQVTAKLQQTVVDSPNSFLSLLERAQELWSGLYGELAALCTFDGKMYLVVMNGEIWLKRGEKFGRVLKNSDQLKMVEGRVQDQDEYIVMTQSCSVAVTQLLARVNEGKLQFSDLQLHFQPAINASGLSDRCAIGIVEVFAEMSDISTPLVQPAIGESAVTPVRQMPRALLINKKLKDSSKFLKNVAALALVNVKKFPVLLQHLKQLKQRQWSPEQRKKIAMSLIGLCVVGLIIVGFVILRAVQVRQGQSFVQPFNQRLTMLRQLSATDTVNARDQVLVLQKEFESQRTTLKMNFFAKSALSEFSTDLEAFVKEVSGKVDLETLPIFYDFRLVRADFLAAKADTSQNTGVFLDLEKQVAIALTVDTKQQTVLPIGQYPTLKDLSFSEDQVYLLADGVYKFPVDSQREAQKIIPEGDSNRDGEFVRVFGDFVYVFNAEKRNLYRYSVTSSGAVSSDSSADSTDAPQPIGWLQDKKDLDFPSVTSFAIDGSVWFGTAQGQILRYERGNPVAFTVQGLQDPFATSIKIYTKEELDSLFVLESGKNRVVRISKDGNFVRQIQSPSLGAATDIIFSPVTNKAYALAGSLVYELAL